MIEIIDNIFSPKDIDLFYGYYRDMVGWKFIGASKGSSNYRKWYYVLNKKNNYDNLLISKADSLLKKYSLKNYTLKRAYANAYTYGMINEIHQDDFPLSPLDIITVMFYLNKEWSIDFGGETNFYKNEEIINSVLPKPGRVVIFDGFIPHCGKEVNRTCVELRMVASVRYEKIS